jgi:hypothetical protein
MIDIYNSSDYRKIFMKTYGSIPKDKDGRSYEIHHIDGNNSNNSPENLKAVSIEEHYYIHLSQGDYGACLLISSRMTTTPEEKSNLARSHVIKQLEENRHPWKTDSYRESQRLRALSENNPFLGGEIQRKSSRKRVREGTHHLLGDKTNFNMIKEGKHPSQKIWTCEHCDIIGKGTTNYIRWHGNNCKKLIKK